MLLFATVMLIVAALMLRDKRKVVQTGTLEDGVYIEPVCPYCWLWLLTEGIAVENVAKHTYGFMALNSFKC